MSSCSSATNGATPSVQQLIKKATNPAPQQAADKLPDQDELNTSGSRGTQVNINS